MVDFYGAEIGQDFSEHSLLGRIIADIFTYVPQLKVERRFSRYSNEHCSCTGIACILHYLLQIL
jgi:hypothetical protein